MRWNIKDGCFWHPMQLNCCHSYTAGWRMLLHVHLTNYMGLHLPNGALQTDLMGGAVVQTSAWCCDLSFGGSVLHSTVNCLTAIRAARHFIANNPKKEPALQKWTLLVGCFWQNFTRQTMSSKSIFIMLYLGSSATFIDKLGEQQLQGQAHQWQKKYIFSI